MSQSPKVFTSAEIRFSTDGGAFVALHDFKALQARLAAFEQSPLRAAWIPVGSHRPPEENCPNGQPVEYLCLYKDGRQAVDEWLHDDTDGWVFWQGEPTHWMRLPEGLPQAPDLLTFTPGLYAVHYIDNWNGEGDYTFGLAELDKSGTWYNANPNERQISLLTHHGDRLIQAWPLVDNGAPELTYRAGITAARAAAAQHLRQYCDNHSPTGQVRDLEPEHFAIWHALYAMANTITEQLDADPVPSSAILTPALELTV